jgi:outer membrane lipoprotein carrier protein
VASALADAKARLEAFVDGTKGLKANFTQTVYDRAGRKTQEASGNLFSRGRANSAGSIRSPTPNSSSAMASKVWIHDEDLDQVTVRKLDQALGDSPAALLAGDNNIDKLFNLKDAGSKDGIEWLEATPKSKEGSFEKVRMGFKGNDLHAMELKDNFGQTTLLRFSNLQRNPALAPACSALRRPRALT